MMRVTVSGSSVTVGGHHQYSSYEPRYKHGFYHMMELRSIGDFIATELQKALDDIVAKAGIE